MPTPEPTVAAAAGIAPLTTPVLAIPSVLLAMPELYDPFYLLIALVPIVLVSLAFGYVGMWIV